MIDKSLVKNSFRKNLKTYDENADIQREMAETLVQLIPVKSADSVLEIGMGTGVLTKLIAENISFNKYTANDIVAECKKCLKYIIPDASFIEGDIEDIEFLQKFDLVVSNATFQWVSDFKKLSQKIADILNDDAAFVFSTFGKSNFKELKNITRIGLDYQSLNDLKELLQKDFDIINAKEKETILYFKSFKDILSHIKLTGVNGICAKKMSVSELRTAEKKYTELYSEQKGLILTYNPIFMVLKKKQN